MDKQWTQHIGQTVAFQQMLHAARLIAKTDATVLISGPSGTGKELLASALHRDSPRAQAAFVAVNCASIVETLFEAALFGVRKGAFTGADQDRSGFVQQAEHGTLFLDEVEAFPLVLQSKLLRFLASQEYYPVGQSTLQKANIRLISASNQSLYDKVQQGAFRADLYYRLNVVPLDVPSLQQRKADIPLLLAHYLSHFATHYGVAEPTFEVAATRQLMQYAWPGNIRELRNVCERMVILRAGASIRCEHLPCEIQAPVDGRLYVLPDVGLNLQDLEEDLIRQALFKSLGNKSKAARLLGLTRDTLLYRLKKYTIAG